MSSFSIKNFLNTDPTSFCVQLTLKACKQTLVSIRRLNLLIFSTTKRRKNYQNVSTTDNCHLPKLSQQNCLLRNKIVDFHDARLDPKGLKRSFVTARPFFENKKENSIVPTLFTSTKAV